MPPSVLNTLAGNFAIGLSPYLVDLIRASGLEGPIARQYLPDARELVRLPGELHDPIGDEDHSPVPGIVHRYPGRVLLKCASVCAVYCRFCFRRELIGPKAQAMRAEDLAAALDYIAARPAIAEVILTGGDPLVLSPARLQGVLEALAAIPHLNIIRIHTRVPVADPLRISPEMLAVLSSAGKTLYIALHINHPLEITAEFEGVMSKLRAAGAVLLSQTVLLKGINDSTDTLADLFEGLAALGVRPYEIHHPDQARGTHHFRLSLAQGKALIGALRGRVSGLAMPHYLLDIPGGFGKVEVLSERVRHEGSTLYRLTDFQGDTHLYEDME